MLRVAHISDLHFFSYPKSLVGYLGKNGLGVLNHLFFRKKIFHSRIFKNLLTEILEQNIQELWISGDISVSGTLDEFAYAKGELAPFIHSPLKIRLVPGNHDVRSNLQHSLAQLFLNKERFSPVETISIHPLIDLICLDLSHNNKKRDSGLFCSSLEETLKSHLLASQKPQIAILCHYPPPIAEGKNNRLVGGSSLQKIVEAHPKIVLFAHGHTHQQSLHHLHNTVVANPGVTRGSFGRYNFYEFGPKSLKIELRRVEKKNSDEAWKNDRVYLKEIHT